jgi:hypothetical protein
MGGAPIGPTQLAEFSLERAMFQAWQTNAFAERNNRKVRRKEVFD